MYKYCFKKEKEDLEITATDISIGALKIAKRMLNLISVR